MVNRNYPQGFPTSIECDYDLPAQTLGEVLFDDSSYQGQTVQVNRNIMLGVTADNYLYLRIGNRTHVSQCRYLTSDDWARFSTGTSGDTWPTRINSAHITLSQLDGYTILRRNGAIEMKIED